MINPFWSNRTLRCMAGALVTTVAAGCASVPKDAGFQDVRHLISDRTGHEVVWNQSTDADRAVADRVDSMLRTELTPDAAVRIALLNNRQLQATYENLAVAQADLVEAGLLANPVFTLDMRFREAGGGTNVEMSLVQNFIDLFLIPLRKRAAAGEFEAAKLRVSREVLDLAARTRTAFYRYQAALQMLELRKQVALAVGASYEYALKLRTAGNIKALQLSGEQAADEQAKLDVRSAEAEVVLSRERLNGLMGLWGIPAGGWTAAARLPELESKEPAETDLEKRAVASNLDLAASRKELKSLEARYRLAAPLATLGDAELGASAEREPEGDWGVGPAASLSIPLFNQGQPAIAKAQSALRRAQRSYEAAAVQVRSQTRSAYAKLVAAREQATHVRDVLLPLRQSIVNETQLQYNAMQVSTFELLQARQKQIETGAEFVRQLLQYWEARTEVDSILSGHAPDDRST